VERISLRDKELLWNVSAGHRDRKLTHEIRNPKSEEVIIGAHKRITETLSRNSSRPRFPRFARPLPTSKALTASPTLSIARPVKSCSKPTSP